MSAKLAPIEACRKRWRSSLRDDRRPQYDEQYRRIDEHVSLRERISARRSTSATISNCLGVVHAQMSSLSAGYTPAHGTRAVPRSAHFS
jgi:hypothetical protein